MPQSQDPGSPAIVIPADGKSQKRKRVTRACDECRKKKVKCDGQQPCIHCTVYSYDCTYDQPTNRKKTGADLHLIEAKLRAAEQVLHLLLPDIDVFESNFSYETFEEQYTKLTSSDGSIKLQELADEYTKNAPPPIKPDPDAATPNSITSGSRPTPTTGTLTPTTQQSQQLQSQQSQQQSQSQSQSQQPSSTPDRKLKRPKLNIPQPNVDGSIESKDGREIKIILPPKNVALELVTKTWASPCVLFRFYHRPSFIKDLDELYETDADHYTNKQNKFLPLAYSVMAVGALFRKRNGVDDKFLDDEGYRYFVAARKLIDITDARDLYAIQTIVMLILFLQCSARLSTCYSYIGVALRSALREGLHRKLAHDFNPIELETRKRIFWTIYKMDIYVNTMLGLPRSISQEDIDQELPLELDDENITEDCYLKQEPGKLSSAAIANCHTKLMLVLNNIVKNLYPINSDLRLTSHDKVSEMELELRAWLSNLPKELIPGYDPPFQYYKANRLLHLAFLHVQIVLYRPFIHYISPKYTSQPNVDPLSIQRAKNCISVARTVVNLAQDMIKKNMLSGSYWFSIYTIFFSVACLVYYVHEVPFDEFHPDHIGIRHDAEAGKEILTLLKDSSMAASRTYNILNSLFEQLNRKTQYIHQQRHMQQQQQEERVKQQQQRPLTQQNYQNNYNYESGVPLSQNLTASASNSTHVNHMGNVSSNFNNFPSVSQASVTPYDVKLEADDFDHLANFDNFINQPASSNTSQVNNTTSNSNNNNKEQSVVYSQEEKTDDYMPGMIDQLDMQIFGRFLPPYMLKRPDGTIGPGAKGGDLPTGLNTTNFPTSLEELPMNEEMDDVDWSALANQDFDDLYRTEQA
ncbi:CYFA0S19e00320g1_1 [Cyberlindnera fabianii]|uniref:CYFA0S19e00320g1_1 n=1 Tax=Cyberlindnera fabianii TaxID=36022 RepID=A0A061BCH3_CYBFA|nr:CYFA0S19e00320g1_1 [Cyberlindnera fabianii]